MVSNMPREFKTGGLYNSSFIAPPICQICDYLTQHQLVMLVTDKNLGCTVAPRTWIIDKTTCLLSSIIDYECISYDVAVMLMREKIKAIQELTELTENSVCYGTYPSCNDNIYIPTSMMNLNLKEIICLF